MRSIHPWVWLLPAALLVACDQTDVELPHSETVTGECGAWYPGGDDAEADYEIVEGGTFPCLVWESVRDDHEDTWLNIGELYLGAEHGAHDDKALVIALTGADCTGCVELTTALGEREAEFDAVAEMLAICHGYLWSNELFTLDETEEALLEEGGWPTAWPVTNDAELHMPVEQFNGLPWTVVVRLSDMEVVVSSNLVYSASNVDELLALVEDL